jgi:hypothetical protein
MSQGEFYKDADNLRENEFSNTVDYYNTTWKYIITVKSVYKCVSREPNMKKWHIWAVSTSYIDYNYMHYALMGKMGFAI